MENKYFIAECKLLPTEGSSLKNPHSFERGDPMITYAESIRSPSISVSIQFYDVDQLISSKGITGGEYLSLNITVPGYPDFEITEEHKMMLNAVRDIKTSAKGQLATIEFVSTESIVNETARLSRKFSGPISETVRKILEDDERGIKTSKYINTDPSANSYSFVGNLKRPFDTIQWLCSKTSSDTDGFGFLFFETLDGYEFKGITTLLEQNAVEYKKTEAVSDEVGVVDDLKILETNLDHTHDIGLCCRMGMFANKTIYVNIDDTTLKYVDFRLDSLKIKNPPKLPNQLETFPTRLMLRVLDKGALQKGSKKDEIQKENELAIYQSKSYARTNLVFSQTMRIAIPLNPSLRAGQMLNLRFPLKESIDEETATLGDEDDNDISGRYLISELRHDIGGNKSKTTLKLVRDTYTINA